jgi:uncharacterized protein YbjT (DUF2867 family)
MIALTGVTGFTGRFVIPALRVAGYEGPLRCLVRPTSDRRGLPEDGVEYLVGDCQDEESLARLINGAQLLVHVAGIHSAESVITACRRVGHRRVVFVNTTGMYSRYRKYGAEYRRIDRAVQESGLDWTIIRPTMIYGNLRDRNISKLVRLVNRWPVMPVIDGGRALMQPIYVEDVAWTIARTALDRGTAGRAYNIAGREPLTYAALLREIGAALGRAPRLFSVPYWLALAAGGAGEAVAHGLVNVEKIQRLQEDRAFSYEEAARDLGFRPLAFAEGIRLEVQALRAEGVI